MLDALYPLFDFVKLGNDVPEDKKMMEVEAEGSYGGWKNTKWKTNLPRQDRLNLTVIDNSR